MEAPAQKEKKIHQAVLEYVRSHPNGCTMSELVRGTGYSRKAIEKHLQVLTLENEMYLKQFGVTKVYYPNQRIRHLESERLDYGNRTIWFDILENEYGKYLLIQKKKKVGSEWVHEHSITIPLEKSGDFLNVLRRILSSKRVKKLMI